MSITNTPTFIRSLLTKVNDPDGIWIIHELRLQQMQGMESEAVVHYRETRHNEADAVRSARLKGKGC
jgi:hypothetical protein